MQSTATIRHLRIAPRKVRLVAELLRGKRVAEAKTILRYSRKRAGGPLEKALLAALSSAAHNFQLDEANLYIAQLRVHEGPKLKRYRPRARGRAYPVQKKASHVTLVLDELVPSESLSKPKEKRIAQTPTTQETQEKKEGKKVSRASMRPEKEMRQLKSMGPIQRIFRRKAV